MKKSIKKLLVLSSLVLTAASAVACSGQKPGSKPAMSSEPVSSVPTSSSSSSSNSSMSSSEELSNNHYEGIGQPPAGLGRNGDTFTDTSTGDVYTKQGGVWVKTSSGQRNNYSGEGDPNPALGENGDKYTDTLNGAVWEKQGGVWIKIQAGDTTYVVTFNLDGGYFAADGSTTYPDQIVREGRWIKAPSVDPVKDHCTFLGWYAEGSQEPWNFVGGAVYGPVNLIARWNVNQNEKIIVTVDPCNGQPTYTHETFVGDYYYPTIPTREGFSFVGWFVKSTQEKYNGYIDGSFAGETLEAHWEKANFNFKFQVEANDEITITGLLDINTVTVTIPAYIGGRKVTKISNSAFNYRTSLVSVNLPATIKELSGQAFAGAYKVNEVNIDSNNLNFVSINGIVFSKSKDVLVYYPIRANQNYTVPNTVKKIGDYAFYDHKDMGLKSINLNEGLEEIGAYAFARNELLASISFPSTLKKIGKSAFYGPSVASDEDDYISPQGTIVSYTWNEGLEEIGEMAFANQYIKDTLKLPNTVKTIGDYAFVNCNAITKVVFPRDLESLGDNAFAAATGVLSADIADGNTHFKVRDNVLYTYDMTELVYCPSGRTEEITIPEGVTKLRQYAFYMVDELQTYNFPSTLKEIGHDCFAHTYGLRSFTIPNSVTTIGEDLFDRSGLRSVTIGTGLTELPEEAFIETQLTEVTIPGNIKKIGNGAFRYCKGLRNLTLNEGVEEIGISAFSSTNLAALNMPDSLKVIKTNAFSGTSINRLDIANSLSEVDATAFTTGNSQTNISTVTVKSGNENFKFENGMLLSKNGEDLILAANTIANTDTSVSVPDGVKNIGDYAFAYLSKITALTFPNTLESIGEGAFLSSRVKNITFPNSLKIIKEGAFYSSYLQNITFGTGLETIEGYAFRMSDVKMIELPDNLKTIGDYAFTQTSYLTVLAFGSKLESIGEGAFADTKLVNISKIPASLTSMGAFPFASTTWNYPQGILKFTVDSANPNYATNDNGALLMDKNQTKVISLAGGANSVSFPATCTEIGDYGMSVAGSALINLTIPSTLKRIGVHGFGFLNKLSTITIPSTVEYIDKEAFDSWNSSQSINFALTKENAYARFHSEFLTRCSAAIHWGE